MTQKETQLKQLYQLKKKLDRQQRMQEKVDFYKEQVDVIHQQCSDPALMPLKKVTNEKELRVQFLRNNRYSRIRRYGIITVATLLILVLLVCLTTTLQIRNAEYLSANASILASYDPSMPLDEFNNPQTDMYLYAIMSGIALLLVLYLPKSACKLSSFIIGAIKILIALELAICTATTFWHMFILFPGLVLLPALAFGLAIAYRCYRSKYDASDLSALTGAQEKRLAQAAQLDRENAAENRRIRQNSAAENLRERQSELDHLNQQIRQTQVEMVLRDHQIRLTGLLPDNEYAALPRMLEFMESNQANSLMEARNLYHKEQSELQRKADADRKRSHDAMVMIQLQERLLAHRRDEANRQLLADMDRRYNLTMLETDIRKELKDWRDSYR